MNNQHKQRIKQRDERGQVDYWRKRAERAESQLADARAARRFDQQPVPCLDWVRPSCKCSHTVCRCK